MLLQNFKNMEQKGIMTDFTIILTNYVSRRNSNQNFPIRNQTEKDNFPLVFPLPVSSNI